MADHSVRADDHPAQRLQRALHFIEERRTAEPGVSLELVIANAGQRFQLTAAQLSWVRWTLDPHAVALQSKEPDPTSH